MDVVSENACALERIDPPTAEAFRGRYLTRGEPVFIRGAVEHVPARGRWSEPYLESVPAPHPVPVDVYDDGDYFAIGGALGHRKRVHLPFREYLRRSATRGGRRYYAPDLELSRYFPSLTLDFRVPEFLRSVRARTFLFAGHDAITAGHFHPFTHALTCQVVGRKRVVLYPPGANLYPNPWFAPAFHWSRVNFLAPDFTRFPRLRDARPLECVLEPGDAVFIPVHWWHWTQGLDFSVSVLVSWEAALAEWTFPTPGWSCLFARCVWPVENTVRALASRAKRAILRSGSA